MLPGAIVGGKFSGHRVGELCKGTSGILDLERRRRRGGSNLREQTPNGRDRALSSENRLCPFPLLRTPTIQFTVDTQPHQCTQSTIQSLQIRQAPFPLKPSVPDNPTRRWPTTPPTNENAMAHTAPVQEKLGVDNSSTHETLVVKVPKTSLTRFQRPPPRSQRPPFFLVAITELAERFSYHGQFHSRLSVPLGPTFSRRAIPFLIKVVFCD